MQADDERPGLLRCVMFRHVERVLGVLVGALLMGEPNGDLYARSFGLQRGESRQGSGQDPVLL